MLDRVEALQENNQRNTNKSADAYVQNTDLGKKGLSFPEASVGARFATVVAGPVCNFILAFLFSLFIVGSYGTDVPVVMSVSDGGAAAQAGMQAGDKIISMDGKKIHLFREISFISMLSSGEAVSVVYEREGEKKETSITPIYDEQAGRYYFGLGVEQDYECAVEYYLEAAEQGNAEAQYCLGELYYYGNRGVKQDYTQAIDWLQKAAEQGNADALYLLGKCYYFGNGVNEDLVLAMHLYHKSAELGNAKAQKRLRDCYYNGYGVEQDYEQSFYWCRQLVDNHNLNSIELLLVTIRKRFDGCYNSIQHALIIIDIRLKLCNRYREDNSHILLVKQILLV